MKRNLSSQAIRAMAIGMAVTMGATTALSGVGGNVAVVKAETTANGNQVPDTVSHKNIEVKLNDLYFNFEVTIQDSNNNNELADDSAAVKLISITQSSKNINSIEGNGDSATPFKGEIISDGIIKVTLSDGNKHCFNVTAVGNNIANEDGSTPVSVPAEALEIFKTVTVVEVNSFKNVTFDGALDLAALSDIKTSLAGATIEGGLKIGGNITNIPSRAFEGTTIKGDLVLSQITSLTDIKDNAFNSATVTGSIDFSSAERLIINDSAFKNAIIGTETNLKQAKDALKFGGNLQILREVFKNATINGDLDLSKVTALTQIYPDAFKGESAENKGITVKGELKLPLESWLKATLFAYTNIGTLTLTTNYQGLQNAFEGAVIGTLKFPESFSGVVNENVFTGTSTGPVIETLDLTNVMDNKLDNKFGTGAAATAATITNIIHNGKTKIGGAKVKGNVTFADGATVGEDIFKDTKFEAGSKITIADQSKISSSINAFQFANDSKTNVEFTDYTAGSENEIKTAFGNGVGGSGRVNILLPEGKEAEVDLLNTALTDSVNNVKAYINTIVAGIDNPTSSITLKENDYILTANGELFKVLTPGGPADIPTAEVAYIGKVEAPGNGGTADGTNIPYVGTLSENILSVGDKECIVTQIGDGRNPVSIYTLRESKVEKGNVMTVENLNIPSEKSIKIADNAFAGATITTITSTEGVTSFGASAFEGADIKATQTINVSEEAVSTLGKKAFAFKEQAVELPLEEGVKITVKLGDYSAANKDVVVGAFEGATKLSNVTVEIPYSLTAKADVEALKQDLTSTGVNATVGVKGNEGAAAPKANDIISTTSGDVFEVLMPQDDETAGTVKLISLGTGVQSRAVTTFDGTFENGVVTVAYNPDKTAKFNVTEIGDGSKAIATGTVQPTTLTPYLTNATKLANKALEGVSIVAPLNVSITIPEKLTELGATSLQLTSDSAIVIKVPGYGTQIERDELVNAIGKTEAQITIELPANADAESADLKAALATNAPRVTVRTELPADTSGLQINATNDEGTYTFEIIQQTEEQKDKKEVRLVAFKEVTAPEGREVQATFTGNTVKINGEDYVLTELGNGKEPISGLTVDALKDHTANVTSIAPKAFEGNTNITAVSSSGSEKDAIYLPSLVKIGESAFADATNLTTVSLENTTIIGARAFENTKVQSVNLPKATEIGENAFANNEKLVSVNVGTEAEGEIKVDSSAFSGSLNITVVNTNKDSKDPVIEAIKQSGIQNDVTVSAGGTTEIVKPEENKKPSNGGVSGGGANIGSSNGSSNITTETVTETTTETITEDTTEDTTQTVDKTLSLDVISLPSVEGEAVSFSDVSDSFWAKSYIDKLSTAGIISGSNGMFNPNGQTKRADVTVMLVKLLGLTPETNSKFTDVDPNAYYAPYVGAASSYGIVNGSNGMFKPENVISRQDTMVMMAQILRGLNLNVNTDTSNLNQFSDVNDISSYAQESVAVLVNSGIISGNNGKLNPTKPVTRAEMATIMAKLYDLIDSAN